MDYEREDKIALRRAERKLYPDKRGRRLYEVGRCQDCGHTKRTTVIVFWVNGMHYRVCALCIHMYRDRILK